VSGHLKHEAIVEQLAKDIRVGRLPHGSQLPGENALAAQFSVSRNTVRQALTELGNQGLIATHSGKGSFVTFDNRTIDDRLGWTRALAEQGVCTVTRLVRLELLDDPELAERLDVTGSFVAIDRVRSIVDGKPISLERSRIPAIEALRDCPNAAPSTTSTTTSGRSAWCRRPARSGWSWPSSRRRRRDCSTVRKASGSCAPAG